MRPSLHTITSGFGPRLVLVSGFTQTAQCWTRLASLLAVDHEVNLVDPPGHGGSSEHHLDLWAGADALGTTGGTAIYVGYSMGGRLCLHLALARPDLVQRLVLVGVTAGLRDPAEREGRRRSDEELALGLEAVGVNAFVDDWLAGPLFTGLDATTDCRSARRTNTVAGLTSSLRLAGTGQQDDLWPRLPELDVPTLLVAGDEDSKFCDLASSMAATIGDNATFSEVPGAGHSAPFEQPERFAAILSRWLGSLASQPT